MEMAIVNVLSIMPNSAAASELVFRHQAAAKRYGAQKSKEIEEAMKSQAAGAPTERAYISSAAHAKINGRKRKTPRSVTDV